MGNAGDPCREFAGVGVSVLLDGCDCLDESLLKDVVCNIFVFDDVEYVVEHTVLMSAQQGVESFVVPVGVGIDQHFVGHPI